MFWLIGMFRRKFFCVYLCYFPQHFDYTFCHCPSLVIDFALLSRFFYKNQTFQKFREIFLGLGYFGRKAFGIKLSCIRSLWYDAYQVDFLSAAVWNTITSFAKVCPEIIKVQLKEYETDPICFDLLCRTGRTISASQPV